MKNGQRRFVDLRGVARDVGDDIRYARLLTTLRKAAQAQSCQSDLSQALSCCDALKQLLLSPRKRGTIERSSIESSLLFNAITLYARGTSTSGKMSERGPIDINSKLDDNQRDDHQILLKIRNRAIAHVYLEEDVADAIWHHENLFLVEIEDGWKIGAATKRVQFHKPTLDRLYRQLPIAIDIISDLCRKHLDRVTVVLSQNPVTSQTLAKNLIDPIAFFGSRQNVLDAVAGLPFGFSRGLTS
ncbi:hypothetical protein [Polymorphobacter megasporae]|uniref:hypothetical protein n=1 Tax=Glacieibacterium megasporae TaxID=2835787 RepID=UPI001C1DE748|nr:hypothetical protein [Polymorphobacter megasporae]UAJ10004.1 hypothetical protein KTC28_17280 [Polymorphobacter megasporae]